MSILREEIPRWKTPAVTIVSQRTGDPFRVLVSCLLSLRTKDEVTAVASRRLFERASDPVSMMALSAEEIANLIFPVGFYRTKAETIREICRIILERHGGTVPDTMEGLLDLPGVGRKTANLTLVLGFGKEGICVDTHVHRICNRWGYVRTRTPEETEMCLREKLPKAYWGVINDWLVTYGQNLCRPISPHCSSCRIRGYCDRVGVTRSR
ncbi:MAG: endonuclease III [Desulfuromonadia bacterium]